MFIFGTTQPVVVGFQSQNDIHIFMKFIPLLFAVLIANYVTQEGRSNWFEGVQLLAAYTILVIAFYAA